MTAAGMLAETVIPAYNPRYAFAAVIKTPSTIPTPSTRTVSSGTVTSGEMKGSSVALTPSEPAFRRQSIGVKSDHHLHWMDVSWLVNMGLPDKMERGTASLGMPSIRTML